MKTILLTIMLFPIVLISQSWIDKGSTWKHYKTNGWGGHLVEMSYLNDTIIQGKNCQNISGSGKSYYTYYSNDSVFYLRDNKFFLLYNFGAKSGDTWNLGIDTNDQFCSKSIVHVDSIGFITINSIKLRWLAIRTEQNSSLMFSGKVIEKIGCTSTWNDATYIFPIYQTSCNPNVYDAQDFWYVFQCFYSNSLFASNKEVINCKGLSVNKPMETENISIYPSLTSSFFLINNYSGKEINRVIINDIQGKEHKFDKNENQYNISHLKSGLYLVKISFSDGSNTFCKLIIE